MSTMTFASLFSGIGGFDCGFEQAGFTPIWMCERDDACQSVLKKHWPNVKLYDDITSDDIFTAEPPDILIGSSPCQGFSVAGLRGSLSDDRSNLCLRFCHVVERLNPKLVVYENVPGILNTKDNAFGCFLAALVGADTALIPPTECGWTDAGLVVGPKRTAAWRVLDSQYFGLAQRRRRVFVVADTLGGCSGQILFECQSSRRNPPARGKAGQGITRDVAPSLAASGRGTERCGESGGQDCVIPEVTGTMGARTTAAGGLGDDFECAGGVIPDMESQRITAPGHVTRNRVSYMARGGDPTTDNYVVSHTLRIGGDKEASHRKVSGLDEALIPVGIYTCGNCGKDFPALGDVNPANPRVQLDGHMLMNNRCPSCGGYGDSITYPEPVAFDTTQCTSVGNFSNPNPGDACNPLAASAHAPAIACRTSGNCGPFEQGDKTAALNTSTDMNQNIIAFAQNTRDEARELGGNIAGALPAQPGMKQQTYLAFQPGNLSRKAGANPSVDTFPTLGAATLGDQAPHVAFGLDGEHNGDEELVGPIKTASGGGRASISSGMKVRRLTPVECARLQGFKDDWNSFLSDGAAYKQYGNAVSVPVIRWIAKRIKHFLK